MARSLISTAPGTTADYQRYLSGDITKKDQVNQPILLDFALEHGEDPAFVKLVRGNYIKFTTNTFGLWFTGFIQNTPQPEFVAGYHGDPRWVYHYEAASDDILLNYQPLGFIAPYINTTQGKILKDLANRLAPGRFDVSDVQDGMPVVFYRVDPTKRFADIVKEFADSSHFRFWAQDFKLHFVQQDSVAAAITVNGTSKHFTPARLKIEPTTDQLVNDCTVLGANEPQKFVAEYWVSDGFTGHLPLLSDAYGAASTDGSVTASLFLDETFGEGTFDETVWAVEDPDATFLQLSNGFLNSLGGNNDGSFDIYIRTVLPILLQGNIRLTHGDIDIIEASSGIIGSLWTTTAIDGATLTGCIYGLMCTKSGADTVISPIVNGAVDTTQSITITDYTKRYVMRTLANYGRINRSDNTYSYLKNDGTIDTYGGGVEADAATYATIITIIDPTDGTTVAQHSFNNTSVSASTSELAAFYAPIISDDMHMTVTSITLGAPMQASLAHKSEMDFIWRLTPPSNSSIPVVGTDSFFFAAQQFFVAGKMMYGMVSEIVGDPDADVAIMVRQSLDVDSVYYALIMDQQGGLHTQWRTTAGGTAVETDLGITIPFGSYLRVIHNDYDSPGTDGLPKTQGYYSLDGFIWKKAGTTDITIEAGLGAYMGWSLNRNPTALTSYVTIKDLVLPDFTTGLTGNSIGITGGKITHSGGAWASQIIGPNEVDVQDGLAPVATVISTQNTSSSQDFNGTYYNPGSSVLNYFADPGQVGTITADYSTAKLTLPQPGTLIRLKYRASGPAVARVQDAASIAAEATAWGDNGHRSDVRMDIKPSPRTSLECENAAASIIQEFSRQHYQGTYQQFNQFEFTGEPVTGTILPFTNMDAAAFPDIAFEEVQEVETVFLSARPQEVFQHSVKFGRPDLLKKFLATVIDPTYNPVIPTDPASVPAYIALADVGTAYAPDVTSVELTGWDASTWQWQIQDAVPSGGGFEVRYTDRSWGTTDGKNLIQRSASTTFTTPRTLRGKTVFVRAYDAAGNYSRYSAAARSNLPLIPQPCTALIDYTNGLHPTIVIVNPTVMQDVWGVEIRATDNTTILYRDGLVDGGYFQDLRNIKLNPSYYIYTYNLLGEMSTAFFLNVPDKFISNGPDGLNLVHNGTFEKNNWGALYNTPRFNGEIVAEEWYVA